MSNMTIAITTPTGNIGRAMTEILIAADQQLVLLVRDASKVAAFADRGARIAEGDLADTAFVTEATRGAETLFWLTPPNYETDDLRAFQNDLGRNAAAAVTANGIHRVVHLSSIGAQHGDGMGPVNGLHDVEQLLNATEAEVLNLRPGSFMENYFSSLATIQQDGAIYLPVAGTAAAGLIATRDIAAVAAKLLMADSWPDHVVELIGPDTLNYDQAAAIIGKALGREVRHVTTTPDQTREGMVGMGIRASLADLFLEMYSALDAGKFQPEGQLHRSSTTLDNWASEVLRGAMEASAG
jgi:uncharacterized protein YbjT (DUF2867 family)